MQHTNQEVTHWLSEFQLPLTAANQRPENSLRRAGGELLYRSYRFQQVPLKKVIPRCSEI
jgi:hypothetical protein